MLSSDDFENGCLELHEIYHLKFDADLITLAACESGLGIGNHGNSLMGFTNAFLYAGTRALVPSLWKVTETSTKRFFADYYEMIAKNDDADKASLLQQAKIKLMNDPRYANPYYWAPFMYIGLR